MVSGIDDTIENLIPRPPPLSTTPVDRSITIPTPPTDHAPKGHITNDAARGTIFWEAASDDDNGTKDANDNDDDDVSAGQTRDVTIEQQNLGHPFRVEWLSTEKLPFHRARGLRNPWNQNREVKIARDGTEIEPSTGRRLVNLFHTIQPAIIAAPGQQMYQGGYPQLNPGAYQPDPRFGRPY